MRFIAYILVFATVVTAADGALLSNILFISDTCTDCSSWT